MTSTIPDNIDALIAASRSRIQEIEQELWAAEANGPGNSPHPSPLPPAGEGEKQGVLEQYHAAFQEMERLIALKGDDQRHEFVIVIPVADRPQHLKSCLDSLLHLCRTFAYGGYSDNRFQKVSVIIADDSRDHDNIIQHKAIAKACSKEGLITLYFGLDEQLDQMDALTDAEKQALSRVLGNTSEDAFYHKGPSIMRNIAYLELNKIRSQNEHILFYFIDSDQEFQVKTSTAAGDKNLYACNYLHYLDRIFSTTDTRILTGKVVGDPPVSPSVMAGNFLEDVICFLHQIGAYDLALPCQFHGSRQHDDNEASYHDMAALFGFKSSNESFHYHCSINGEHDNARCFSHFSDKLSRFFYGEHPTRKTYYHHEDVLASVRPARTVYTGNYIFKPEVLKYFIPFAPLKLRMAGPVLGRLIKSELSDRFVSANLPLLHKRTVRETGQSEFRPGISAGIANIDLSGEFERQFYGDVMLFSIEKLIAMGYPQQTLSTELIAGTLEETHASMLQLYNGKRVTIAQKLNLLKALFHEQKNWWSQAPEHAEAANNFKVFIKNMEHNFGDRSVGYDLINSSANKSKRYAGMTEGIASFAKDRLSWAATLAKHVM
jgi:hypothetical protein